MSIRYSCCEGPRDHDKPLVRNGVLFESADEARRAAAEHYPDLREGVDYEVCRFDEANVVHDIDGPWVPAEHVEVVAP